MGIGARDHLAQLQFVTFTCSRSWHTKYLNRNNIKNIYMLISSKKK